MYLSNHTVTLFLFKMSFDNCSTLSLYPSWFLRLIFIDENLFQSFSQLMKIFFNFTSIIRFSSSRLLLSCVSSCVSYISQGLCFFFGFLYTSNHSIVSLVIRRRWSLLLKCLDKILSLGVSGVFVCLYLNGHRVLIVLCSLWSCPCSVCIDCVVIRKYSRL